MEMTVAFSTDIFFETICSLFDRRKRKFANVR